MKNKDLKVLSIMFLVLVVGFVFRIMFLNKAEGLWNDEYVSWSIASIPLGKQFWNAVVAQCQMPLYYFYLKIFIKIFGSGDYLLRLTSVIPSVLSIISMFFVGREVANDSKNIKLGVLCATITSISSFLIYYSQEVGFYSLLFLFVSLSLLFTLKIVKKQSVFNIFGYVISNILIVITHSIGFIFVFFNVLLVCILLTKNIKNLKKKIFFLGVGLLLLILISAPIITNSLINKATFQWWGVFSISEIGFLITDYFSPVLTNLINAPSNFFYDFNGSFLTFAILPSIIAISGIIRVICTKNKEIIGLFYVSLGFAISLVIISICCKLVFITKFSIEIYPTLILLMAFGLLEFKKWLSSILIFSYCFLNLYYVSFKPTAAQRLQRTEGNKLVASLLSNAELQDNDWIILTSYNQDKFKKYFDFNKYNVVSIDENSYGQYLGLSTVKSGNKIKNETQLKDEFKNINDKYFDLEFNYRILSKLKLNQKVSVVMLNRVSMISPMMMESILENAKTYSKTPYYNLVFSQIRNGIFRNCVPRLQILKVEQMGNWCVVTFEKK